MLAIYLPKVGIKLYTMSFQILLLVSILFVTVINPYYLLKIVLDTMFILHFVVGTIMHGYNNYGRTIISMVQHRFTGANYCTGTNYCKAQILFGRHLFTTMSTQRSSYYH